ncbi:MAG: hypothetical protein GY832_11605 [Chloroflexi bacterium]|nr:hypothetical protein [Chloroflexota bacterium]
MIRNVVADSNGHPVEVNRDAGEDTGLVVATRPHKTLAPLRAYLTNSTYGHDMTQDAAYGGAGLLIHDGTDNADWSNFSEVGTTKWTEDSTDRFYADAKSIKCDNAPVGSYAQFINATGPGNDITITGAYVAVTMWINVDKDWALGDSVTIYARKGAALEGNSVKLEDYFDYTQHDVWQFIAIPVADLGIQASDIDAFRIEQAAQAGGKAPKFYIDLFRLEATGTPVVYSVTPAAGTWYHVHSLRGLFADANTGIITVAGATETATLPALAYDQMLGATLTEGLQFELYRNSALVLGSSFRVLDISDMLAFPGTKLECAVSDGTNTMIAIEMTYAEPLILKAEENDEMRITLNDDFSALLRMEMSISGAVETR